MRASPIATVLPEPVCDEILRSRPSDSASKTALCTDVRSENPRLRIAAARSSGTPSRPKASWEAPSPTPGSSGSSKISTKSVIFSLFPKYPMAQNPAPAQQPRRIVGLSTPAGVGTRRPQGDEGKGGGGHGHRPAVGDHSTAARQTPCPRSPRQEAPKGPEIRCDASPVPRNDASSIGPYRPILPPRGPDSPPGRRPGEDCPPAERTRTASG